uniref:Uncharacterized protein n=1 Tax=Arundo donax TaxID=35708 RepID=A0A0A9ATG7_ARUDO
MVIRHQDRWDQLCFLAKPALHVHMVRSCSSCPHDLTGARSLITLWSHASNVSVRAVTMLQ